MDQTTSKDMSGSQLNPADLDDKENIPNAAAGQKPTQPLQHEVGKSSKEPPATPSGRLALPELIAMSDVGSVAQLQLKTPDDRVTWDHDINASNSSAVSYVAPPRKGNKRARSSSPMSSPAHTSSHFAANPTHVDLQHLSLKTPQTGPGLDLWSGYAVGTNKPTPRGHQNPLFAHLMETTSSPQGADRGSSVREGTLRRSLSCGTQFPKRRRVGGLEGHSNADIFSESTKAPPTKLSRVSALLDGIKVKDTSPRKPAFSNGPSSSSPAPRSKGWIETDEASLALKIVDAPQNEQSSARSPSRPEVIPQQMGVSAASQKLSPASSDYGDFDDDIFDDEALVAAMQSNNRTTHQTSSSSKRTNPMRPVAEQAPSMALAESKATTSVIVEEEEDEFGDWDDEIFAADVEDIVAKYEEAQPLPVAAGDSGAARQVTAIEEDSGGKAITNGFGSDDEYGDDLDDVDFVLAEAAATQSLHNSASSFPPVRMKYP